MTKEPTKQYFVDAIKQQSCRINFVRLMPNNINTCKLIEQTLEENGYSYVCPTYQTSSRAKFLTNRNNRTRVMYITVWNDNTYGYGDTFKEIVYTCSDDYTFPVAYVTSKNARRITCLATSAIADSKEDNDG